MRMPLVSRTVKFNGAGYKAGRIRLRNKNSYGDDDKAKALVITTLIGSVKASKILPIPQQTLSDWLNGRYISGEAITMAKHFAKELEANFEGIIGMIVNQMPKRVNEASLKDLSISLGIAFDKLQLLKGLPTAIHEDANSMTADERAKRLRELFEKAEARANGGTGDGS